MLTRWRRLQAVLILMMLPELCAAEVYRYIDENGMIHFTDNYIEIPQDRRPEVEIVTRTERSAPPALQTETGRPEEDPPAEGEPGAQAQTSDPGAAAGDALSRRQVEALIRARAELDKMYESLSSEKEALEKEQSMPGTPESVRVYRDKVNLLNKRLDDYERRRREFQTRAEAYNRTVAR